MSFLKLSHHCPETTMSKLALCNTEVESPHLLAIGSDIGSIDIINLLKRELLYSSTDIFSEKINYIDFLTQQELLVSDNQSFLLLDYSTNNRNNIFQRPVEITAFTFNSGNSSTNVFASTADSLYFCDLRTLPTQFLAQSHITDLCLFPDDRTLFAIQSENICVTDVRNPEFLVSLGIQEKFLTINCNNTYLVGVTNDFHLFSFDLPLLTSSHKPPTFQDLLTFSSVFPIKPSFFNDFVMVGDSKGCIYLCDPSTSDYELFSAPQSTPIVSLCSNSSEIALSLEDDIYIFSSMPYEDSLIHPIDVDFVEEEAPEPLAWQNQTIDAEPGLCTYEKFGYCEQQIYICLTCSANVDDEHLFGICEQCAEVCHSGHDVHCIGARRNFRCDCGNDLSNRPCQLMEQPKVCKNIRNRYGHNFREKWCFCDMPDNGRQPMIQCLCCSDWYHFKCIGFFTEDSCLIFDNVPELSQKWIFICSRCIENRLQFLKDVPDAPPPPEIAEYVNKLREENIAIAKPISQSEGVGFSVSGGKFLSKTDIMKFNNNPEFQEEFGDWNQDTGDELLPKSLKQEEFSQAYQDLYNILIRKVKNSGRNVVQASDVHESLKEAFHFFHQRHRDEDDQ